ncbi:hypothetical protein LTR17_025821 [Elasticomyces elasticus]|nr:hypothetical protein LTR17_025821 [Elasticomyces elasticus]
MVAQQIRKKTVGKIGKADLRQQTEAEEFRWHRQIDFDGWYEGTFKLRTILRHAKVAFNKIGQRKQTGAYDLKAISLACVGAIVQPRKMFDKTDKSMCACRSKPMRDLRLTSTTSNAS